VDDPTAANIMIKDCASARSPADPLCVNEQGGLTKGSTWIGKGNTVWLSANTLSDTFAHEFAHLIGLWHSPSRYDEDFGGPGCGLTSYCEGARSLNRNETKRLVSAYAIYAPQSPFTPLFWFW
jgi:hypothetical protein